MLNLYFLQIFKYYMIVKSEDTVTKVIENWFWLKFAKNCSRNIAQKSLIAQVLLLDHFFIVEILNLSSFWITVKEWINYLWMWFSAILLNFWIIFQKETNFKKGPDVQINFFGVKIKFFGSISEPWWIFISAKKISIFNCLAKCNTHSDKFLVWNFGTILQFQAAVESFSKWIMNVLLSSSWTFFSTFVHNLTKKL